ncbi:hypothetical protein JB92DRAFT_1764054 [Gautieria morchelliformis]|nr:hypothetical protein JB92DRAFT_1764054 [Gautieria morchelliformis]
MFPSYSGSPSKRLTTLPEVWEAMMEEQPSNERDSSVPRRIPHVQVQGGDLWRQYNKNAKTLEDDLHNFHDKVQELGSSLDIARAARKTKECLSLVSWFVRENAKSLFPLVVKSIDVPQVVNELYMEEAKPSPRWPPAAASSINLVPNYRMGSLHSQLTELSQNIESLRVTLEQFPEFNSLGKRPLVWFGSDLKYWSSCLERYEDQYDIYEVKVYVHDLSSELGKRFKEQHSMSNQQTLATIATFFSAVTATAIQYAVGLGETDTLSRIVLALWFSSLVFSIASALNSSIALIWRSATYSTPEMRIPPWLWIWIRQCPVIFLLVSVVTFLAGLVCFAAATQPRVTWIIVLVCEGISSFTLAALLLLLAADKWSSYRYRLQERPYPRRLSLARLLGEKTGNVLPTHIQHSASWGIGYLSRASAALAFASPRLELPSSRQPEELPSDVPAPAHPEPLPQVHPKAPSRRSTALPPMQRLWRRTIRKVILLSRATQANAEWGMYEADRMTALESHIRNICPIVGAIHHEAGPETSDMDFRPDGTSLAICGKRLTMQCEIGSSSVGKIDELRHYVGQARQVIWLTSGQLLTRTSRAVHVWTLVILSCSQKFVH